MEKLIRKHALQNAVLHDGRADVGAVVGKVLAERPELRKNVKVVARQVAVAVSAVNKMKAGEQRAELEKSAPELLEKKELKKGLPELKNAVMGRVVTRIPPEPSKYAQIGHALSFLINYLYAQKYKGKCILRFEDTNPEKSSQEFVDAITGDVLDYLGIKVNKTVFVSDELPKMYKLAEQLIKNSNAYVCFCEQEKMRSLRHQGLPCGCREKAANISLAEWKKMLNREYKEGECVLRLKADMSAENQVMRDPVIFRLSYTKHYRQLDKFVVWPMYDFENAVMDSLNGITHVLRSNEFGSMRIELQEYIKDLLKLPKQEVKQYGRFNITGYVTQGRVIREMVEKKQVSGWDDPRLVTLKALKRRGIQKETFYELAVEVGLSPSQTNIGWEVVASINRKLLDKAVDRYFFVREPVKIAVKGAPLREVKLKLHPDFPERGYRGFKVGENFFIAKQDYDKIEDGELVRLMDCLNFVKKAKSFVFDSPDHDTFKSRGKRIIHWLPADNLKAEVLMPDGTIAKGLVETNIKSLKAGDIVQFARFGFCKLENKERLFFVYCHE